MTAASGVAKLCLGILFVTYRDGAVFTILSRIPVKTFISGPGRPDPLTALVVARVLVFASTGVSSPQVVPGTE